MKKGMTAGGISFTSAGEGEPLILIHGWAMASSVWQRQIGYFSGKGFEVLAVDLRGHGESLKEGPYTVPQMAYDLKNFIHETGHKSPFLVGWSRGAMVALEFAAKHSHTPSAICLVGGTPRFTQGNDFSHGLPLKDVKGMKVKIKRDFERSIREFRQSIAAGLDDEKREILMNCPLPTAEAARAGLSELLETDLRDCLEGIKTPVLLVHGTKDHVCLPGASRYMDERLINSELHLMENAGHVPFLSHQAQFNRLVEDFIRRH